MLLLQESPPRGELIDAPARRVIASIALEIPGDDRLAKAWADPAGSRGEGAVFLPEGHLLVAKEKDPSALIEFGPPGAQPLGLARGGALSAGAAWEIEPGDHRYVALAAWWPDKPLRKACRDFSDLEIGPDGHLYLLSDKSDSIARLSDLAPTGGTVSARGDLAARRPGRQARRARVHPERSSDRRPRHPQGGPQPAAVRTGDRGGLIGRVSSRAGEVPRAAPRNGRLALPAVRDPVPRSGGPAAVPNVGWV